MECTQGSICNFVIICQFDLLWKERAVARRKKSCSVILSDNETKVDLLNFDLAG